MSERIVLSELDPDLRGAVAATRERVAVDQGLIDRLNDGMDVIGFEPGVLSMHSPFEVSSKADLYAAVLAYGAFYRS